MKDDHVLIYNKDDNLEYGNWPLISLNTMSNGTQSPTAHVTNPHLKKVLKAYTRNAMNSLGGPGNFQETWSSSDAKGNTSSINTNTLSANTLSGGRAIIHHAPPSSSISSSLPTSLASPTLLKSPRPPRRGTYSEQDLAGSSATHRTHNPPPFPVQPAPLFSQPDQTTSERCETIFEEQTISYFLVGGEKRLCLPQLLNTVLTKHSLEDINTVCDDLRVYISRCTDAQLECLKASKILPTSAPSFGLITLTDAERLCGILIHRKPDVNFRITSPEKRRHFPVIHRCFGKLSGICFLDVFTSPSAPCIECAECHGLFSPRHFVLHSHRSMEYRVCHWGFDSSNWRHYLHVPEEEEIGQEAVHKAKLLLEELKSKRFEDELGPKRGAFMVMPNDEEQTRTASKRIKIEEAVYPHGGALYGGPVGWYIPQLVRGSCAPVPGLIATPADLSSKYTQGPIAVNSVAIVSTADPQIPSYLNRGPPMIINPDRIVLASTFERSDEKLQPNVALAPPLVQQPRSQSVIQRKPEGPIPSSSSAPVHISGPSRHLPELQTPPAGNSLPAHQQFGQSSQRRDRGRAGRSESDDDTSSNSTLSIDFREESAILDGEVEDLKKVLQFVDIDTRQRVLHEVRTVKHRYREMLLKAQHDKDNADKDLQYYKTSRKEKMRELRLALTNSENEKAQMQSDLVRASSEVDRLRRNRSELQSKCTKEACLATCTVAEKDAMTKRIDNLENENRVLREKLSELSVSSDQDKRTSQKSDGMERDH